MADDVKDIAIYTGSEWTSLSELAAGVVDAKLPIESVDGSVALQSQETNKYQIIVGGASRVDVTTSDITFRDSLIFSEWQSKGDSPSKITLDAQATINVGGKVFNVASNDSDLAEGDGGVYTYNRTGVYSVISNGIHFNSNAAGGVKSVSWKMDADGSFAAKTATQSIQCANYRGQSPNELNGLSVSDVVAVTVDGENKLEISSQAVKCRDAVWCDTFLPYDGAGAKLALGSNALWTIDTKLLEFTSNTGGVAGGSGLYVRNRTDDLAFVSDEIRFNSNASGGVLAVNWVMDTKGDLVAQTSTQEIECTNYRGQGVNTDNGFTIDSSVKVTVNGDTKLNISSSAISAWPDYEPSGLKDLVTREYCDNASSNLSALPISSTDDTVTLQSPAADEFEVELAGEMKLRITADDIQTSPGYQPRSDTSLVTKRFLYANSNDSTPTVPPGQNSGAAWQTIDYQSSGYKSAALACDGVFTTGAMWSVDGVSWNTVPYDTPEQNNKIYNDGFEHIASAYFGMYHAGNAFSYNMKNWVKANPRMSYMTTDETAGPLYFWKEFFYCTLSGAATSGSQGRDPDYGGRVPEIRSGSQGFEPAGAGVQNVLFDYAESQWAVPNRQREIWNWTQLASDDDTYRANYFPFVVSNPDGNQAVGIQRPMHTDASQPKTTASICYLKENTSQDFDSADNYFMAQWTPIPQLKDFNADEVKGIACNFSTNTWVFITSSVAYSCTGDPATATWRTHPITPGNWTRQFHFNGENFIAVTSGANTNFAISSPDGMNWETTTNIATLDDGILCGTNGRSILSNDVSSGLNLAQLTGSPPIQPTTTADVLLNVAEEVFRSLPTTRRTLSTQEDANEYLAESTATNAAEIATKAVVITLTQAAYDAIPSDQLDDQTLYCITD